MVNKIKYMIRKGFFRSMDEFDINRQELELKVKEGAKLVDVRSPQEYQEGHLNGAISIPEYELTKKAQEFLKNKDEMIILYCSTGSRSKKALKILKKIGYQNVFNLYHGLESD